jgi:hypothetical protein
MRTRSSGFTFTPAADAPVAPDHVPQSGTETESTAPGAPVFFSEPSRSFCSSPPSATQVDDSPP